MEQRTFMDMFRASFINKPTEAVANFYSGFRTELNEERKGEPGLA